MTWQNCPFLPWGFYLTHLWFLKLCLLCCAINIIKKCLFLSALNSQRQKREGCELHHFRKRRINCMKFFFCKINNSRRICMFIIMSHCWGHNKDSSELNQVNSQKKLFKSWWELQNENQQPASLSPSTN